MLFLRFLLAVAMRLFEAFAPQFVQSWGKSLGERFGRKKPETWDEIIVDVKGEKEP